jgi:predicted Zn-dependent peptidase
MPSFDVMDQCRSLHFDGHPCGNSVLGSEESIDNLTSGQMRDYFSRRYAPNNMALACAGNFDWEQICSIAQNSCSNWQQQVIERKLEHYDGSKKKKRADKSNLSREHLCLMSSAVSAQDSRRFAASLLGVRFAASLLGVIVGDSVGSRFFWELIDKALAEAATMHFGPMDGTGAFYSYIRCSADNVTLVLDTVNAIFQSLSQDGVTEDELRKAKNKVLSSLVIKNELPMGRLGDLGSNWLYLGQYRTVEDDVNAIKAVSVDDVNVLIEQFKPGDFTQLSIGPVETK